MASSGAEAVELSDRIDLHGFGYQDYAQTSANSYLDADKKGTWNNDFLGLVLSATLSEKSKLWAQLEDTSNGGARFTWAFVDYELTDSVRLHAGRVKFPLGFYNEIIDAKGLQPAALEPSLYQSAADMVHDAYQGVGADFEQDFAGGHLLWQGYGGNAYDVSPPETSRDRRVFGGRVTFRTPIDGLTVMGSGYRTQVQTLATGTMSNEDRVIASIGYATDALDLKAEYGIHHLFGVKSDAWYVQGAYALSDSWKPYVRYDSVVLDSTRRGDASYYQDTWVGGVGYRVDRAIGLKVENHFNRGYGLPVVDGSIAAGAGHRSWNLLVLAADFQF
jgi:hypothetical protein